MRKELLLLITIIVGTTLLAQAIVIADYSASQPVLPGITYSISASPAENVSINKPAIIYPGDTFTIKLKSEYSGIQIAGGFIYTVKLTGSSLKLYNYTITVKSSPPTITVTVPQNIEGGVYDLVLTGSANIFLPRSVWVIRTLGDVLRIVHISDQHYGAGQPDIVTGDMNRFAGYVVADLLNPDIVIDTGDIADTASALQYQAAVAFEYAFLYNYPIFSNPGNHDVPNDNYIAYLGDTNWYRVIGGKILIIAVNTREEGYLQWDQIVFLENTLKQFKDVPIKILLMHHPMFYYQGELVTSSDDKNTLKPYTSGGPWTPLSGYWSGNMTSFFYTLRLIEDYNITYVLAGHVHRDLFVKYTSTRTNTTTYFLTITTLGMGSAIYDGLDLYAIDTSNGALSMPVVPNTFIGFNNITGELASKYKQNLAMNSLPIGIYPPLNNYNQANLSFIPGIFIQSPHAYIVRLYNNLSYLNLSNIVLWSLPWKGDFSFNLLSATGGASANVVDKMLLGDRLYIALNITLPYRSGIEFAISNMQDSTPPLASIKLTVPKVPTVGRQLMLYLDIKDSEWGPKNVSLTFSYDNNVIQLAPVLSSPGTLVNPFDTQTYLVTLPAIPSNQTFVGYLNVTSYDNANNKGNTLFKIVFYPPDQTPTVTPIVVVNQTTSPAQTTSSFATTTTSAPQAGANAYLVAGIIVVVALVVIVAYALARKK